MSRLERAFMDYVEKVSGKRNNPDAIHYQVLTIDLGTAHTNQEYKFAGDFIQTRTLTGTMQIRLNNINAPLADIVSNGKIYSPFKTFFVTNTAQAGTKAILYIGGDAAFETDLAQVANTLNNVAGVQINPATEDTVALLNKYSTTPTIYTIALTTANRELDYFQALPASLKKLMIKTRGGTKFSMSWASGSFASGSYTTIPAGATYSDDNLNVTSITVYLGSSTGSETAEIMTWT